MSDELTDRQRKGLDDFLAQCVSKVIAHPDVPPGMILFYSSGNITIVNVNPEDYWETTPSDDNDIPT